MTEIRTILSRGSKTSQKRNLPFAPSVLSTAVIRAELTEIRAILWWGSKTAQNGNFSIRAFGTANCCKRQKGRQTGDSDGRRNPGCRQPSTCILSELVRQRHVALPIPSTCPCLFGFAVIRSAQTIEIQHDPDRPPSTPERTQW